MMKLGIQRLIVGVLSLLFFEHCADGYQDTDTDSFDNTEGDTAHDTSGYTHSVSASLEDAEQNVDSNDGDDEDDDNNRADADGTQYDTFQGSNDGADRDQETFSVDTDDEEENPEEDGSADIGCGFGIRVESKRSAFISATVSSSVRAVCPRGCWNPIRNVKLVLLHEITSATI